MNELLQLLSQWDTDLLLAINGWHNGYFDTFMYAYSGKWVWVPMYGALVYLLFRNLHWRTALLCLVGVALTITFADQVGASLIRPWVERLRPSNPDNPTSELVHIVNGYRGGRYGFPSCHAGADVAPDGLGGADVLLAGLPRRALSGRPADRCGPGAAGRGVVLRPVPPGGALQASRPGPPVVGARGRVRADGGGDAGVCFYHLLTMDNMNNVRTLGGWMNDLLTSWGLSPRYADMIDEMVVAALIILLAVALNYFFQAVVAGGIRRYTRRFPRQWTTLLMERKAVHHLLHVVPGILIYLFLPLAFVKGNEMLDFSQRVCMIYIIVAVLLTLNALLLVGLDVYNSKEMRKNHPIRGFVQVLQVVLFFVGGILAVSVLIDKSPVYLFTGLGASAAVLMLVFKDSILGFVAGVQLSANDMLRIGDWVTLPNGSADGIVQEITLNTVKIQNWDNTITTIPPYTMVNSTFQNWRGMQESGGRRVDKRIWLDLDTVRFSPADEVERLKREFPLLADYAPETQPTNSQLYRTYIERYLTSLPVVNQELDLIIAQKEPTEHGLPIRVYFFSRVKAWKEYERIQSDIFDHLLAVAPRFGLKLYQGI